MWAPPPWRLVEKALVTLSVGVLIPLLMLPPSLHKVDELYLLNDEVWKRPPAVAGLPGRGLGPRDEGVLAASVLQ